MQSNVPEPVFLNVEYIFSWLWGHIFGPLFSQNTIAFLQFLLSILIIIGITIILYSLVRIHEMKQDDAKKAAKEKKVETPITTASTVSTPGAPALPVQLLMHLSGTKHGNIFGVNFSRRVRVTGGSLS